MAKSTHVRFAGELQSSIRDEQQDQHACLRHELKAGNEADVSEFASLNADALIKVARARKKAHQSKMITSE